jgi:ABC-2 type transport system permease protein
VSARGASTWTAVAVLWRRELVHFSREPGRIAAAIGQPLLFWVLLGAGFGSSMKIGSVGYLEFFFPGMILLTVLFATIFSTITVIEDRQQGFLRAVMASPASRASVVLGKALGSATLACAQGAVLLLLAPAAGIPLTPLSFVAAVGVLFIAAYALSAVGLVLAASADSSSSYHAWMSFILLPLWLLSGALFPAAGAPIWLEWILRLNPLSYCLQALRHAIYPVGEVPAAGLDSQLWLAGLVMTVFVLAAHMLAVAAARRRDLKS